MTKCNIKGAGYHRIHSRCESPGCRREGPGDATFHVYADHFLPNFFHSLPIPICRFLVKMLTLNLSLYVLTNEDHQSRVSSSVLEPMLSLKGCGVSNSGVKILAEFCHN